MKKIISIIFVFCCFSSFSQKSSILKGNGKFEIFNAILYRNTPDLSSFGIKEFFLFYEDELLDKYTSGNRINKNKIRNAANTSYKQVGVPVCLDIETWELDDANRDASLSKYLKVIEIFKRYNNISKVGFFGVFPMDSPHAEYSFKNDLREAVIMPKWHESNNFTKKIGRKLDVFYPVFYTRYQDREIWIKIVKEKTAKIREINTSAKIYGFIWPQYYTNDSKYKFISREVWREQLETLYKYCDGAVIWSHYLGPDGYPINFDYQMDWFQETIDFIKDYNITSSKF